MDCPNVSPTGSDADLYEGLHYQSLSEAVHIIDTHRSHPDKLTAEMADISSLLHPKLITEEKEAVSGERSFKHKELSQDGISEILDMECGEPMMSQHLRIDFNPLEGVDDSDYMLKKCMSFWKLVEGSKMLQELKALPEKNVEPPSVKSTQSADNNFLLSGDFPPPRLGAIEVMEDNGRIIDDCFMNKMKRRYCEEGSGDYFVNLPQSNSGVITKWVTPHKCGRPKHQMRAQREQASKLCEELEQWDVNHPKCMEPPNHGPPHTYAVMQKN